VVTVINTSVNMNLNLTQGGNKNTRNDTYVEHSGSDSIALINIKRTFLIRLHIKQPLVMLTL